MKLEQCTEDNQITKE